MYEDKFWMGNLSSSEIIVDFFFFFRLADFRKGIINVCAFAKQNILSVPLPLYIALGVILVPATPSHAGQKGIPN